MVFNDFTTNKIKQILLSGIIKSELVLYGDPKVIYKYKQLPHYGQAQNISWHFAFGFKLQEHSCELHMDSSRISKLF